MLFLKQNSKKSHALNQIPKFKRKTYLISPRDAFFCSQFVMKFYKYVVQLNNKTYKRKIFYVVQ